MKGGGGRVVLPGSRETLERLVESRMVGLQCEGHPVETAPSEAPQSRAVQKHCWK